jgi:hypothetical protein
MSLKRAWQAALVTAVVCSAGLPASAATAATPTVAWGTIASAPAGNLAYLFGVAASSSSDALAVGGYNPGPSPQYLSLPFAEHWNGSRWTATPLPDASVYPVQYAQLSGVTEVAAGDGWAVGAAGDYLSLAAKTLAYHWNGTAWQRVKTPNPAGQSKNNELAAVAAGAASDVWAVGGDGGYSMASLVLQWNGSTWAQVAVPSIGALDAVAVTSANVWVAGGNKVEWFNGSAWTSLPALPTSVSILGLAHTTAGLWAVGLYSSVCGEGDVCTYSYAARWNGAAWVTLPAGGSTGLSGVVAAGSAVLATGGTGVVQLSATAATPQVTPTQNPPALMAIGADPAGQLWAAGENYVNGKLGPAIINAPGIGQGGILVDTGASEATVTWTGPVKGTGSSTSNGKFATGGLPDGTYTITAALSGCQPGVTTATVSAGLVTSAVAKVVCSS